MFSRVSRLVVVCCVVFMCSAGFAADIMNYQGRLTNASGTVVPDGNYGVTFKIFSALSGGSALWTETHPAVATSGGLFAVQLGSVTPLDLAALDGAARYLEIQIGADAPLTPRSLLATAPRAASAGRLTGRVETDSNGVNVKRGDGETGVSFGSTFNKASMYIFAPQPEPPKLRVRIEADASNGGNIGLYDDAGEVMGLGPSPFNGGASIRMFAPQPEPPRVLIDMHTDYDDGNASSLLMAGSMSGGGSTIPLASMSAKNGSGTLRIGLAADAANQGTLINAAAGSTESRVEVLGPPFVGGLTQTIAMYANNATARVGIGTATPTQALQVIGNICYTGSIGACSDAKYKRNVRTLDRALDKVMKMRGVGYDWRLEDYPEMRFSADRQVGFVAQEVKSVLPEAVTQQPDGSYTVDYSRVTPLLLEAIKELRSMVEEQQSQIRELKAELKAK